MKLIRTFHEFFLIVVISLCSCNDQASSSKPSQEDTSVVMSEDSRSSTAIDPATDPLIVGAAFAKLLYDTLGVRLYEMTINPGDSVGLHAHPDHAVYILEGGKVSISFNNGPAQQMDFKAGTGLISGPLTDAGKNIGSTTIRMVVADVYSPRPAAGSSSYAAALDPLTVSGANAKLLRDTLGIKIFVWWMKPGEPLPLHQHPDHAMYVLETGKVMVYSKDLPGAENGMTMEVKKGGGWIGGPVADSARNIGNTTIKMLEIDFYRPRAGK